MSASPGAADTAFRVADRIGAKPGCPWDVFGESIRRYEVHLNGRSIEMVRGPIRLEGYGIRLIRPSEAGSQVGFAASSDPSEAGVDRTLADAETSGRHARFPAKSIDLPGPGGPTATVETVDRGLWERPEPTLEAIVAELLRPFDRSGETVPSFGSVRATLSEGSLANSAGAARRYARTVIDLEFAVKSSGGPEGAPPGEYWVNRTVARLDPAALGAEVAEWIRKASEVRRAQPTPHGDQTVVFPVEVLSDILPDILGYRFGGSAELRGMMPTVGTPVAPERVDIADDGLFPFGLASAPWDDEGTPQRRRMLVAHGRTEQALYDLLYASALGKTTSGSGRRNAAIGSWFRFASPPGPGASTIVLSGGTAGSDRELVEAVREGIWVDQLGYAFPDAISSAFGGEIRMGYRIRAGRLAEPIRGGTVGGTLLAPEGTPSVLRSIRALGSASRTVGRLCAPSVAIASMSVASAG